MFFFIVYEAVIYLLLIPMQQPVAIISAKIKVFRKMQHGLIFSVDLTPPLPSASQWISVRFIQKQKE